MSQQFLVDINPNIELPKYELVLTKLNEETLCELHNIEDLEIKAYFVNINEISFRVPFFRIENDGSQIKNELFDLVDGSMMVLVNDMEYFILTKPEVKTNEQTGEIYKTILGFSRQYELGQKRLVGYEGVSRKLYDYSNAKDSDTGLEIGFLNHIENTTSWKIGYINADLLLKYRHLSFPKSTYLQSFTEVQRAFGCIFKFNTKEKIIDVYEVTQLGKSQGLYISNHNFINSLSQTINHDELKTRLYLYGNNNISVQSINITGSPYVQNLNFFKNTKYMSQNLIDALNAYESYIQTKQGLFNGYLTQLNTKNAELGTRNDELVALQTQLKVIQPNLDVAISSGQPTGTYKTQETAKLAEITTKKSQITTLENTIAGIHSNVNQISIDTDMTKHFTEAQARELDPFIREDEYSDSNYTEDNLQELLDEGKKILNKISYPNLTFNVDVEDFLSLVEGQHMWNNFILGDFVTLEHEELGFDYEVRLVGYTHNPSDNKLNLTFSNRNSVDDPNIELKDLLEGLTTTSSNVDFSRYKWDKGENANSMINNYINSNLDLEKQKIMGASSQKPLVDERGIWLVKDVDGVIDNEQTRLVNNAIVMTKDGWNTSDIAISPNSGINANLINGKIGNLATLNADQVNVGGGDNPPNIIEYIDTEITDTVNNLGDVINNALSDGKLTNIEANSINLALDSVTAESTNLILNATSLGITTEKTNYSTALATLTSHLNTNWLGKEYPLEITSVQRTAINDLFKDLEDRKSILLTKITEVRAIKEIEDKAIVKGALYNGVRIDSESGLVATRSDDTSKTTVNATEGIKIQGKVNGVWQDNFYVDTNGFIRAKNIIIDGLDSGNKTFNTTPTVPYALNDLWKVSGIAGVDFKICTTARATGSYVASDWTNITNNKDYADTIKNLTSGNSISGGITTIDNSRVRVEHSGLGGQYSEMRADGFVRKWRYGDAKYLNGLWAKEYSFNIDSPSSSIPNDVKVELPVEFRGRDADIEIILVPTAQNFANASPIGVLSNDVFRFYSVSHALKPILKIKSKYLTVAIPYINVASYMDTELMWYDGTNIKRYYASSFLVLVVGK